MSAPSQLALLPQLLSALAAGRIRVVDLSVPLQASTPILALPEEFGQTVPFELHEISRYDDRGPAWYWNNFTTGEHTGTHFDAPVHWVTGKDGEDVAQVPPSRLVGPAVVLDVAEEAAHGPLPEGGWLLYRTGWDARNTEQAAFLNADETGPHTPGISAECARWLAEETRLLGIGTETVGTDAGGAHAFDPAFPCHAYLAGSGKYGLAQLQNLTALPTTGAVLVAAPLRIVGGSGSPARVLALVEDVESVESVESAV
jgi:kynurenine formamidase